MNCYTYDEIEIGDTETFIVTITDKMMQHFFAITGDANPLHNDKSFAAMAGFDHKVVYGMLTASFMSTLAGVYLPGQHSIIHKSEAEFPAPVFVGDIIALTGEVVDKNDNFRFIELKVTARNGTGKKILRGKMRVGVMK